MNERGFFTLIGMCFLIVISIMAVGVQESEGNYYSIVEDFQTAAELQNIADSALIEAVDLIQSGEVELELPVPYAYSRSINQYPVTLNHNYDADVQVFYEYGIDKPNNTGNILLKERIYPSRDVINRTPARAKGVVLISVASRDTDKGRVYRSAIGYYFKEEPGKDERIIHFMTAINKEQ